MSVHHQLIKCHVRALHVHHPYLFIGCGNRINICHTRDINHILKSEVIFDGFNVNGIISEEKESSGKCGKYFHVAVFGNRFLDIRQFNSLCYDDTKVNYVRLNHPFNCHDWIMNVTLVGNLALAVLSHNQVMIIDWQMGLSLVRTVRCDECSHILYSARILSHWPDGQFVLAGGTVFKEIVIWASFATETEIDVDVSSNSCILQRLKGHDGVIFALDFNAGLNVLASASDDRSVRIWTNKNNDNCCTISENSVVKGKEYWQKVDFQLIHTLYSHESRIWKVSIVSTDQQQEPLTSPLIISVGEDSAICFWDIRNGCLIRKEKVHKNVSIWCFDMSKNSLDSLSVFAGASDGSVVCVMNNDVTQLVSHCDIPTLISPMASQLNPNLICPKSIAFIGQSANEIDPIFLVVSSNDGAMYIVNREKGLRVNEFSHKSIFADYCVMNVSQMRDLVVMGSKHGHIALMKVTENDTLSCIKLVESLQGKVFSVCFAGENRFISCGLNGKLKIHDFECSEIEKQLILPMSKHRWPTCALLSNDHLIIGDRCGNIFTYYMESTNSNPTHEFRHTHGHDGVTCIKAKPKSFLFYTCGRNGKIFEFSLRDGKCTLLRMFKLFTNMEWIGGIKFDDITGDLQYIFGFSGRNFLVWCENQARIVWQVECGGGHRSWDFHFSDKYMHFAFVKQDQIYSCRRSVVENELNIKHKVEYFHSKKVNCCCMLNFNVISQSDNACYFATGSEDNQIFICKLNFNQLKRFKVEMILCGHISNVSAISSCPIGERDNSDDCLLVSVGGRAQLMVWKFEKVNDSLLCQEMICHYLRSDGNDGAKNVRHKKPWQCSNFSATPDAQMRYLSVEMTHSCWDRKNYYIYASSSDPAIRLFLYDNSTNLLNHLMTIPFVNQCVFSVRCLRSFQLISGSSDGMLRLFQRDNLQLEKLINSDGMSEMEKLNQTNPLDWQSKSHQSGVNAIDTFHLQHIQSGDFWLISSGGDDNSLCLNVIQLDSDPVKLVTTLSQPYAHNSQITGIKIISHNQLVSSSIDQRIHLWQYSFHLSQPSLSLTLICSFISCIADINCLEILQISAHQDKNVFAIVCGEGIEIVKLDQTRKESEKESEDS